MDRLKSVLKKPASFFKRIFKKKRYLAIAVLFVLAGGWYLISSLRTDFELETQPVKKGVLVESVTSPGKVMAKKDVDLSFQISGKLTWVGVKEGDTVRAGQTIALLDSRETQKNLQKYLNFYVKERNSFDETQEEYEDWPELSGDARDDALRILENAQLDLENAVLDVELRSLAVELTTLTTPISGIVTHIDTPVAGVNITPSSIFSVVDPQSVYFEAEISEFDIPKISKGQQVKLILDAYPDETLEGTVETVNFSSTTTSTGGTAYLTRVSLPLNTSEKFRLGMNGEAEFILDTKEESLLVPVTAVIEEDDVSYVWIIEDEKAKRIEVELGASSINNVQIKSGIQEGDVVIVRPPTEIKEGDKVKSS